MKRTGRRTRSASQRARSRRERGRSSHAGGRQSGGKLAIRLVVCGIILLAAVVIKQVDTPAMSAVKETMANSINQSANVEDIQVFFNTIPQKYEEFKNKAVAVFFPDKDKEQQSKPVSGGDPVAVNPASSLQPVQEDAQQRQSDIRTVSALDIPTTNPDEELVDFDSGEGRGDLPSDVAEIYIPLPLDLISPVPGGVSSGFGKRINPVTHKESFHYGVDIAAPKDTDILAVADGVVTEAGESVAYGNYIVVAHDYGVESFYGHCNSILAAEGQQVKQGEPIAKVGATGWATGNHLHLELRKDGIVLTPGEYVPLNA